MSVLSLRDARPETQQPGQAPRWRWLVAGIAVLALMLLAQALDVMRMPYVICGRAPAYDVLGQMEAPGGLSNRIAVENVPTYQGAGSLLQTPVWCAPAGSGLDGVVSVADAWLAGNLDVHPRSDRATADEFEREAYLMPMARAGIPLPGAGSVATVIGVRSAGHQVSLNAVVLRVDKGANERSQLKEYDNILSIAGVPVSDPDAMLAALDGTPAEESVDVTLRRAGLDHPGPIADPTERMRWHQAAGFRVVDRVDRSRRGADGCFCMFGDPMYALGLHDRLTEGSITPPRRHGHRPCVAVCRGPAQPCDGG